MFCNTCGSAVDVLLQATQPVRERTRLLDQFLGAIGVTGLRCGSRLNRNLKGARRWQSAKFSGSRTSRVSIRFISRLSAARREAQIRHHLRPLTKLGYAPNKLG
jgi:hypothetical protein